MNVEYAQEKEVIPVDDQDDVMKEPEEKKMNFNNDNILAYLKTTSIDVLKTLEHHELLQVITAWKEIKKNLPVN